MDIEDLYAMLPGMICTPGCTECCRNFGVPSRTREEDRRIQVYLEANGMAIGEAVGTCCPYVTEEGCSIHPVRPFTCRLYGVSPNYMCQWGARPVEYLHEDVEAEVFHLYRKYFF